MFIITIYTIKIFFLFFIMLSVEIYK